MANAPAYDAATARADKMLEPDGSIQTHSGTVVSGPSAAGAAQYTNASARADKLLQPDGSIITSGGGTGGGSTVPGGSSGQLQYNNSNAFGGVAGATTDGTNLALGGFTGTLSNPLTVGSGANVSVILAQPNGTPTNQPLTLRGGGSSSSPGVISASTLNLFAGNSQNITLGYIGGNQASLTVPVVGNTINGVSISGSTTGNPPIISAIGSDTNLGLNLVLKGTGGLSIVGGTGTSDVWYLGSHGISYIFGAETNPRWAIVSSSLPQYQCNVYGSGGASMPAQGSGWGTPVARNYAVYTSNGTALTERMRIDGNGNMGIGTASPQASLDVNGLVRTAVYTVATLPAASAAIQGARALVTDATAPTFLGTLTGGGSVICPVFCNGTAWIAG